MIDRAFTLPSGLALRNRLAKSATSECLAGHADQPSARHTTLYARFASGGAGLLITGNVVVDARHVERPGNVVLECDAHHVALERWAAAARGAGTPILMQLNHPGRQASPIVTRRPVAPSAVDAVSVLRAFARPRALEHAEILDIIQRFGRAARWAEAAGFSGVQIHAAHGYLVSQFLSPLTNRRTDRWGGSLDNRARFLREIVAAVRARTSSRFSLSVKLNSADFQRGGFEADESLQVVRQLAADGIDLLEVSGGTYEAQVTFGYVAASTQQREAYFLGFAQRVRELTELPLMITGGFRTATTMREALASGAVDLIGLARPILADPALPGRLLRGEVERAAVPIIQIRPGALRGAAEFAYYDSQMRRMARGRDPDSGVKVHAALACAVARDLFRARRRHHRTDLTVTRQPWTNA